MAGYGYMTQDVIGGTVRCLGGSTIGTIVDVVVGWDSGKVRYAIVRCADGALECDEGDLLAIPWRALSQEFGASETPRFVLPLPLEQFERAPFFDAGSYPDFNNSREMAEVHSFYGEPPVW